MHLLGNIFMDCTLKPTSVSIDKSVHVLSDMTTYCTLYVVIPCLCYVHPSCIKLLHIGFSSMTTLSMLAKLVPVSDEIYLAYYVGTPRNI